MPRGALPKVSLIVPRFLLSVLIAFSGKEAAATDDDDDDSGLNVVAFKDAQETFDSPPTIQGVQHTLDVMGCD